MALRYPEKELASVPAAKAYAHSARPLQMMNTGPPVLTAQQQQVRRLFLKLLQQQLGRVITQANVSKVQVGSDGDAHVTIIHSPLTKQTNRQAHPLFWMGLAKMGKNGPPTIPSLPVGP